MTRSMERAVELESLVAALEGARIVGSRARRVRAIVHDSRAVRPGSAFVALRGERVDGHDFLERALENGAEVLIVDAAYAAAHELSAGTDRPPTIVVVPHTRPALSRLAATFYEGPSKELSVIGVTGTNGKTTTTHLVQAIFEAGGVACGRIGTLGARFEGAMWPLDNTTPLALELQEMLARMRERGARAVAMEVSSHALALDRVADVSFAYAVLTNVTRDHLDFHPSFEAYAAAKHALFSLPPRAALPSDDALGAAWAAELRAAKRPVTTFGFDAQADVRARTLSLSAQGTVFEVDGQRFELRLPGRFNVQNALAALAVARAFDIDDATSARALEAVESVPGRMERISGAGVDVLVDYAHTPDALEVVLRAARETTSGRLLVVFGCGGDRDRGKRPQMGRIAGALADRVVVTSDNPRREDPRAIVDEILTGIEDDRNVAVEVDRRAAIRQAILEAGPGDLVVVAGKGHETYQVVGETVNYFDDRNEVRAALAARGASSAP